MSLYYLILWNQVDILQKHFKKDHVHICASGRGFTVYVCVTLWQFTSGNATIKRCKYSSHVHESLPRWRQFDFAKTYIYPIDPSPSIFWTSLQWVNDSSELNTTLGKAYYHRVGSSSPPHQSVNAPRQDILSSYHSHLRCIMYPVRIPPPPLFFLNIL